jgi:flavodoxin
MAENILIAYYSWGGSTRRLAEQIQASIGGELFEIIPQTAYPKDYNACVNQAKKEIQAGYKPALKKTLRTLNDFPLYFWVLRIGGVPLLRRYRRFSRSMIVQAKR